MPTVEVFHQIATQRPDAIRYYAHAEIIKGEGATLFSAIAVLEGRMRVTRSDKTSTLLSPGQVCNFAWLVYGDTTDDRAATFSAVGNTAVLSLTPDLPGAGAALLRAVAQQHAILEKQIQQLHGERLRQTRELNAFFTQQANVGEEFAAYRQRVQTAIRELTSSLPMEQADKLVSKLNDLIGAVGSFDETAVDAAVAALPSDLPPSSENGGRRTLIGVRPPPRPGTRRIS